MPSVDEFPESEVKFEADNSLPNNSWLVRPCERYHFQYKDCKSIKARVHQYFIFGQSIDCNQWYEDYMNCLDYRKTTDVNSLQKVIDSEMKRKDDRLATVRQNDVWEYRNKPPDDWSKPLPKWFQEKTKSSVLFQKQQQREELKKNKSNLQQKDENENKKF
ncbi:UPF0545 protein C22orf39 homolog [Oppia nitens]|uniref:UPF0545 protein C22orf39 homolog n=1 Tax=Oppia nitens TaxID=1686743 RepID=UPI0023DA1FDE|nr:UPF0545 protein C22orf39 homolog [Oppia nitens]